MKELKAARGCGNGRFESAAQDFSERFGCLDPPQRFGRSELLFLLGFAQRRFDLAHQERLESHIGFRHRSQLRPAEQGKILLQLGAACGQHAAAAHGQLVLQEVDFAVSEKPLKHRGPSGRLHPEDDVVPPRVGSLSRLDHVILYSLLECRLDVAGDRQALVCQLERPVGRQSECRQCFVADEAGKTLLDVLQLDQLLLAKLGAQAFAGVQVHLENRSSKFASTRVFCLRCDFTTAIT